MSDEIIISLEDIESGLQSARKEERDKVLDELKAWCVQMKCNGCPYGGVLFHNIEELRQAGEP